MSLKATCLASQNEEIQNGDELLAPWGPIYSADDFVILILDGVAIEAAYNVVIPIFHQFAIEPTDDIVIAILDLIAIDSGNHPVVAVFDLVTVNARKDLVIFIFHNVAVNPQAHVVATIFHQHGLRHGSDAAATKEEANTKRSDAHGAEYHDYNLRMPPRHPILSKSKNVSAWVLTPSHIPPQTR